jgi:polyphosphate kinase 2 (PPK2 family)
MTFASKPIALSIQVAAKSLKVTKPAPMTSFTQLSSSFTPGPAALTKPQRGVQLNPASIEPSLLSLDPETVAHTQRRGIFTGAPGSTPASLQTTTGPLPTSQWPSSPQDAAQLLQRLGFEEGRRENRTSEFARGAEQLTLTTMAVAGLEAYVVQRGDTQHVQLGELAFSQHQWAQVQQGYTREIEKYNALVNRPVLTNRSPLPRDESQLHGPHDGLKHLLNLASGAEVHERRVQRQELAELQKAIKATIAQAQLAGRVPEKMVVVVEGLDGASKTGNGLSLSRILEDMGFLPHTKAFRAPSAEERTQGVMGRYQSFVNAKEAKVPTVWFLDRGFPGDFVHNPTANLTDVVDATHAFETELKNTGVLLVKMLFSPGEDAPLATFGKRMARSEVAADLLKREGLSDTERESLNAAASLQPGLGDFKSVSISKEVEARYRQFAAANQGVFPWAIIDTADRHQGRVAALNSFHQTLTAAIGSA